jgi:threonine aldolase
LTTGYGDWAYNEDEVVKSLEKRVAQMFGKEDAAFVISGTFGNQASMNAVGNPG